MNALFELINRLTPSEKRYFKKNIVIHAKGETNSYLQLFDYLSKQTEYKPDKIKHHFAKEKFIKNYPVIKKYLWEAIIKSLKSSTIEKSIDSVLRDKLESSEILLNKGLFKSALKIITQAKRIAIEYKKDALILVILEFEKEVRQLSGKWDFQSKHNDYNEEIDISSKVLESYQYENLSFKFNKTISNIGLFNISKFERDKINAVMSSPLIQNQSNHANIKSKIISALLKGKKYLFDKQRDLAIKHLNIAKDFMEKSEHYKQDNKRQYSHILVNLLLASEGSFDNQLRSKTIDNLKKFKTTLKGLRNRHFLAGVFRVIAMSELEWYISNKKFANIQKSISEIEKNILLHSNFIPIRGKQILYYLVTYIYFILENYEASLNISNMILNHYRSAPRKDLYVATYVLNLICNYHEGNTIYLVEMSNSLLRYIENHKFSKSPHAKIVKHLKKLVLIESKYNNNRDKIFMNFHKSIQINSETKNLTSGYFNFSVWLDALKEKKTYLEILTKKK